MIISQIKHLKSTYCCRFNSMNQKMSNNIADFFNYYMLNAYRFLLFRASPFWIQLSYFTSLSFLGYLLLKLFPQRMNVSATDQPPSSSLPTATDFDLFFTSVSATTVSSMSVVEMESFSEPQLLVLTLLMLLGGEVFTSMLALHFRKARISSSVTASDDHDRQTSYYEQGRQQMHSSKLPNQTDQDYRPEDVESSPANCYSIVMIKPTGHIIINSVRCLEFVVLGYLVFVHAAGFTSVLVYLALFPSARSVLQSKGIRTETFSIFTTVSTFANCGFVPTNENMMVFRTCTGMLLAIAALVLAGNTMYPLLLRLTIRLLKRVVGAERSEIFHNILENYRDTGYADHLLSGRRTLQLGVTVVGFTVVQNVVFCLMEWRSEGLEGLNSWQKIVAGLFHSVNARHAGESVVDISALSSAVLVLTVLMMYLPPYTTFSFIKEDHQEKVKENKDGGVIMQLMHVDHGDIANTSSVTAKETAGGSSTTNNYNKQMIGRRNKFFFNNSSRIHYQLVFSQLTYLSIFVMIICITERKQIVEDPLNFNVLNIVIEVISAYGNVGFSTGYSCKRKLRHDHDDPKCKDSWIGFSGRWSTQGKLALVAVMFFGRLKKFSVDGGRAWKLN